MKPTNVKCFLDSNIILYLNENDGTYKKDIVANILLPKPFVSSQVIFECLNVCLKKFKYPKEKAIMFVLNLFETCTVVSEEKGTCILALDLFSKYNFQPYDSKIVATALDSGCKTLYSEDMQNGLIVNKTLTITNPFLAFN